jgi:hypothetical protein
MWNPQRIQGKGTIGLRTHQVAMRLLMHINTDSIEHSSCHAGFIRTCSWM